VTGALARFSDSTTLSKRPITIEVNPDHGCDSRPCSQIGKDMA
jgi:hypothetical protein